MININKHINQQTLSAPIFVKGIGLHTGTNVSMKLVPAEADFGIKFYRTDIDKNNSIDAIWSNVSNTILSTTISNKFGVSVSTIEHIMSALSGLHIDNLKIEINGPEVPIMDGSSKIFVNLIETVPVKILNKKRKILKVRKNIKIIKEESSVELKPNKQFSIDFEIDFPSKIISRQSRQLQLINGNYNQQQNASTHGVILSIRISVCERLLNGNSGKSKLIALNCGT